MNDFFSILCNSVSICFILIFLLDLLDLFGIYFSIIIIFNPEGKLANLFNNIHYLIPKKLNLFEDKLNLF